MAPSAVWLNFKKVDSGRFVECLKCGARLKFNSNTTPIITHLKKLHNTLVPTQKSKNKSTSATGKSVSGTTDINPVTDTDTDSDVDDPTPVPEKRSKQTSETSSKEDTIGTVLKSTSSNDGSLEKCFDNLRSFSAGGARHVDCTNALMYMVCKDTMPLCTPERMGFRKFCNTLQPLYTIPAEETLTKKIEAKYHSLRDIVGAKLASAKHITLSCDIWTYKSTMKSFLGVTAHFCYGTDIESVELGARLLVDRKTSVYIATILKNLCEEWSICYDKVRVVVTDGGANIKKAVKDEFGEEKHLSCLAHQLNLIGQKSLGTPERQLPSEREPQPDQLTDTEDFAEDGGDEFDPHCTSLTRIITQVKRIVRFFRQSDVATSKLTALQKKELGKKDGECLKLIQETKTRWDSCFYMVDRYLQLASLVTRVILDLQREKCTRSKPPAIITAEEEDVLADVQMLLSPLEKATREISIEKTVTLSKCIPLILQVRSAIEAMAPTTEIGKQLRPEILENLKGQFGRMEEVKMYAVATILDPRFKKLGFSDGERTPVYISRAFSHISDIVKQKIKEDHEKSSNVSPQDQDADAGGNEFVSGASTSTNRSTGGSSRGNLWKGFDEKVKASSHLSYQDMAGGFPVQLRTYLDSPPVDRGQNTNPLQVWRVLKAEYKYLYPVAQEYLSILATSVPSERLFSHAGLISSQLRTRLSGRHLEMLVFLRSVDEKLWFK